MKIHTKDYLVREGEVVDLTKRPTIVDPVYGSKFRYEEILAEHVEKLSALQEIHYASSRHAVLLVFQAMDAAGKDGAIRHVMSGVNPQGCQVFSFKHPSATELEHDFLWRTTRDLPERGRIGIFNRSYYEEVLVVRVHRGLLHSEAIPDRTCTTTARSGTSRYRSIVDLERHLHANGTRVVKIIPAPLERGAAAAASSRASMSPTRTGRSAPADIEERKFWKQYRKAYEECLGRDQHGRRALVRRAGR